MGDDADGWGLLRFDAERARVVSVNRKYWVLAQYTRHIRPGMEILTSGSENTVAAYDLSARAPQAGQAATGTLDAAASPSRGRRSECASRHAPCRRSRSRASTCPGSPRSLSEGAGGRLSAALA